MAKDKSIKNDGSYIFADFSRGLYLLDTPRYIGEQLASLALTDGRNVWSEKGALVPQYGYSINAVLPKNVDGTRAEIKAYSKGDTSNDDFMVLANKTLEEFNNDTFTSVGSPTISDDGIVSDFSLSDYICNTIDISSGSEFVAQGEFTYTAGTGLDCVFCLGSSSSRVVSIYVDCDNSRMSFVAYNGLQNSVLTLDILPDTSYTYKIEANSTHVKCYLNGEDKGSLEFSNTLSIDAVYIGIDAVLGTPANNCTCDLKQVLIENNGSVILSGFEINEYGYVFLYSASQGLKEYATKFEDGWTDPIVTRRGKDLLIYDGGVFYIFGGNYIADSQDTVLITTANLSAFGTFVQFSVDDDVAKCFWNGKQVVIDGNEYVVSACYKGRNDDDYTVRMYRPDGQALDGGVQDIFECAMMTDVLQYEPDNTGINPPLSNVTIVPRLMSVANNRLFIEHNNGTIYYSAIGTINDFKEAHGAGYFSGFYNDTTKLLSIEDFLSGIVITKENGMYYLTIESGNDSNNTLIQKVNIEKISQVGQTYASDHVIVNEKIYAYDKNSGSIVNAISVNVFGSLVSGKTLVSSEYLNVQNFNITSSRRSLVYNAEAQVLILYYGTDLKYGIVYTMADGRLFPRELDKGVIGHIGFNQGVIAITKDSSILQDFKKGTIIPNLSCVAVFEPIGLRDNRLITSSILEITEMNGINYKVSTVNAGTSNQNVVPSYFSSSEGSALLPFLYSEFGDIENSFELTSRWAEQSSHMTRVYAPMSGRNGVGLTFEFEPDRAFCLSILRLPDFSQGN